MSFSKRIKMKVKPSTSSATKEPVTSRDMLLRAMKEEHAQTIDNKTIPRPKNKTRESFFKVDSYGDIFFNPVVGLYPVFPQQKPYLDDADDKEQVIKDFTKAVQNADDDEIEDSLKAITKKRQATEDKAARDANRDPRKIKVG